MPATHTQEASSPTVAIFIVATLVNYVWELTQAPLYVGYAGVGSALLHCFIASLGDGLIVLLIYAVGSFLLRSQNWVIKPGVRGYLLMSIMGLLVASFIEWAAMRLMHRWSYTPQMPLLPIVGIGIVPLLQMVVLPPIIFKAVAVWMYGKARADNA